MRDLLLLSIIVGSVPFCLFSPFYGILVWTWIAYFNPHRFTWSYMYNFPLAAVIAVPTLLGMLFSRDVNRRFLVRETWLLLFLWAWFGFTYLYASHVPFFEGHILEAKLELVRISKILLMTFAMILLVTSQRRLKYLVLVTAGCFGVLAIKGMIFGLGTAGQARVWGPQDSFIADNNAFGLALNMSLPMFYFLAREEKSHLLRLCLYVAFFSGILAVILTYSRGGLLGLAVVLAAITFKSNHKVLSALLMTASVIMILTFAPEKWMARMHGFLSGQLEGSAQQRLVTWATAWNFARDYPITGGSFRTLPDEEVFQRYQPEPLPGGFLSSGPHSIYFQLLSEQGFVGLGLFLALVASCWLTVRSLRRRVRDLPSVRWLSSYTHIVEVSLLGFMASGAFLGIANFDLLYQIFATAILLKIFFQRQVRLVASAQ